MWPQLSLCYNEMYPNLFKQLSHKHQSPSGEHRATATFFSRPVPIDAQKDSGSVSVVELEWGNDAHIDRLGRRFNFIVGCVWPASTRLPASLDSARARGAALGGEERRCDLLNSEANVDPLLRTIAGVAADDAVLLFVDSVRTPASDRVRPPRVEDTGPAGRPRGNGH